MPIATIEVTRPDISIGERRVWVRERLINNLLPIVVTVKRIVYRCEETAEGFTIVAEQVWCEYPDENRSGKEPERVWFNAVRFESMELA